MAVDDAALARLRDDLLAAMGELRRDLRAEFTDALAASEVRLEARLEARLGARIDASAEETRRHVGVIAEDLRGTLALVAEGVVTLTERLAAEMREGFEIVDRRLLRLEARLLAAPERG